MQDLLPTHFQIIARALSEGRVVPLLGAGVNLAGRPSDAAWQPEQYRYLPSGVTPSTAPTRSCHRRLVAGVTLGP